MIIAVRNVLSFRVSGISDDRFDLHTCCIAFFNQRLQLLAVFKRGIKKQKALTV
jgi:hypothetical protein